MKKKLYNDINLGILRHAPSGKKILDVGCGTGVLGSELRGNDNYIFGVDISEEELDIAKNRLDEVDLVDISQDNFDLPRDFDVCIFADILEHMAEPLSVLLRLKKHLRDDGIILISLPNVACYTMRLSLLFGQFNYKEYGLLDTTHLRFFTKKTAQKLTQDAGLEVVKIDATPFLIRSLFRLYRSFFYGSDTLGNVEEEVLASRSFALYRKWIFPIERIITNFFPTLLAYQFIIVAKKVPKNL